MLIRFIVALALSLNLAFAHAEDTPVEPVSTDTSSNTGWEILGGIVGVAAAAVTGPVALPVLLRGPLLVPKKANLDLEAAAKHDVELAMEDTPCATKAVLGNGKVKEAELLYVQILHTSQTTPHCLDQLSNNLDKRIPGIKLVLED